MRAIKTSSGETIGNIAHIHYAVCGPSIPDAIMKANPGLVRQVDETIPLGTTVLLPDFRPEKYEFPWRW